MDECKEKGTQTIKLVINLKNCGNETEKTRTLKKHQKAEGPR